MRTQAMNGKLVVALALFVIVLVAARSFSVDADSTALGYLKTHIATLQQVLTDPKLADHTHQAERRKLERLILQQLFDFHEMARRSLGADARKYEDRMREFTPLFIDFLEHVYVGELEENGDAKIKYVRELIVGDKIVEIDTKTKLRDGSEYSVDYRLMLSPAGWRV